MEILRGLIDSWGRVFRANKRGLYRFDLKKTGLFQVSFLEKGQRFLFKLQEQVLFSLDNADKPVWHFFKFEFFPELL